ncbi:MAG: IS3 family transposase [Ferruginibacter sp.]
MGEAIALVRHYQSANISTRKLLQWSAISCSSYYYKPSGNRKGIKPSTHSFMHDKGLLENSVVVKDIELTLRQEFCCYGYHNMTSELKELGWIINHKKVYKLMKVSKLLHGGRIRPEPFKRNFIRFRSLRPDRPLQYLSMHIKYVHVHGTGRNALLLTVIDIYSRRVLIHMLRNNIRKGDVLVMLSLFLLEYPTEGMTLRNDNGSQFIANAVRQYLKEKKVLQEFSHVATPEDNAYIEALHSNLQREVMDRFEFDSIYHAQMIIDRYYKWYNEKRKHGSLQRKAPETVWNQYFNPFP